MSGKSKVGKSDFLGRILIVDDDEGYATVCKLILRKAGYDCDALNSPAQTVSIIRKFDPQLVILDLKMPGVDSFALLTEIVKTFPDIPVIIATGYGSISKAVEVMKLGAVDFLEKPVKSEDLKTIVKHNLALFSDRTKRKPPATQNVYDNFSGMIAQSELMTNLFVNIRKAARSDANVFIFGESGTGKELVARAIHRNSQRAGKPFVIIDCPSLARSVVETELFGYEKGAFTGANKRHPGLFEGANGGSIFFDEINKLDTDLQSKILRVLQERQIRRVGSRDYIQLNVRIITASNVDPMSAIKDGSLLTDLFYRLNVIDMELPPLRERGNDVALLADHFLTHYKNKYESGIRCLSPAVTEALKKYHWPGNIRELQNVIERLVVLDSTDGKVRFRDLPYYIKTTASPTDDYDPTATSFKDSKRLSVHNIEQQYIKDLVRKHGGNKSNAAKEAGISRTTLYRILRS